MAGQRLGTECSLFYDAPDRDVDAGDVIVSSGGSAYLVLRARRMRSKYVGRYMLRCLRISPAEIAETQTVHPLVWYSRNRRR